MSYKLCFLVAALLLASASLSLGSVDPAVKRCRQQCEPLKQIDKREAKRCIQQCESRERHDGVEERGSPEERLKECSRWCQLQPEEQRRQCQSACRQQYEQEKERERSERGPGDNPVDPRTEYEVCREVCTKASSDQDWKCERKCERQQQPQNDERERREEREGEQEQEQEQPYVFEDQHFFTGYQSEHGRLRVLQKFTDRSRLLRGIENYRVAIFEAQPQTFIVPSHWDAESLAFVAKGRGTVSSVYKDRRESYNIKEGDIFRVKAGTTTYMINRDNRERLVIFKLLQPVNTPGEFEAFYGAGGENPESFYRAFSNEILEAAFNTRSDKLERLFSQQKRGAIIKASEEQIRGMSHGEGGIWPFGGEFRGMGHGEGGIWPFGGEFKGTHNLYERTAQRNQYGQLYEVDANQFSQLRDLNVAVSLANISQGAMTAPLYNSRATKISVVVKGEGYFEMACPHLSESQSQSQGQTRGYQKIRSNLKVGTVVVVPAGHPFVAVASNNQNLQLLCFEINAYNNEKFALAGKGNVIKQLEREAKELAFGVPAREVDEVFNSQQEEYFFKGPRQQGQGRADM